MTIEQLSTQLKEALEEIKKLQARVSLLEKEKSNKPTVYGPINKNKDDKNPYEIHC